MADTPPVAGPVPASYTNACYVKQPDTAHGGGWGGDASVFTSLAVVPGAGITRRKWRDNTTGFGS